MSGRRQTTTWTATAGGARLRRDGAALGLFLLGIGPVLILVLLVVAMRLATPFFATPRNVSNILAQTAVIAIVAMGQHLVILTRGIDLSVGSIVALASVLGALLHQAGGGGAAVAAVMIAAGTAVGAINGAVYVFGRLPHPFIITLATLSIARGLALQLADGRAIPGMPPSIGALGSDGVFGLPGSVLVVAVVAGALLLLMRGMVWGRWLYAVGGRPESAVMMGIPVPAVLLSAYVISGATAGIGAVVLAGRTDAGSPLFGTLLELDTIAAVHSVIEKQAGVGNVWSVETLRRWLAEKAGRSDVAILKEYVDLLPPYLVRRFISAEQDAVVVSGRVPDLDSSQILPTVEKLDAAMGAVRQAHPGYEIAVTGLSAIAARNSANMIGKLNHGLTIEFGLVAAFIGLAFRSVVVMLASILPGIFPVVLSGTVLWLLGEGLQFASVVALTVSFGLGLSATIHFLNRLRLEERPGVSEAQAVERATVLVGPALILTTVVLACGLVVTVFSDLPSLRLFGWLSAFAMIAALVADLFILRPTAMWLISTSHRLRAAWGGRAKAAE